MKILIKNIVLFFLLRGISSEIITFNECPSDIDNSTCEVTQVRIDPCGAISDDGPCIFKRNSDIKIEFDYTPYFNATTLSHNAYSVSLIDLPMPNADLDGCQHTECPVIAGQKQVYKNQLKMLPFYPLLPYTVKWRLWNDEDGMEQCCFTFKIKLVR